MTGKEIRRWARQEGREQRGFFAKLGLFALLPSLPSWLLPPLAALRGTVLPSWCLLPFTVLTQGLSLCLGAAALSLARTGQRQRLTKPLQEGGWKRILLAGLLLVAVTQLLGWGPGWLRQQGAAQMLEARGETDLFLHRALYQRGYAMSQLGSLLGSVTSFLSFTALFPVRYLLFLEEGTPLPRVFGRGLRVGVRSCFSIFAFTFWLELPLLGWMLLGLIPVLLLETAGVVERWLPLSLLSIGIYLWFRSRLELGLARYALELLAPGEGAQVPEEEPPLMARYTQALIGAPASPLSTARRRMKLVRRGPWYYWDNRRGPTKQGPLERK